MAKLTINPARIYGIDHEVGSLEVGKLADIVLWEPKFFGIKPEVVFKGGFPVWSVMGESNASLMTCEPLALPPAVGRVRPGAARICRSLFTTQAAIDDDVAGRWSLRKRLVADARHPRADQARHAAQRRAPCDRGRPGDLPGRRSTVSCAPAIRSTASPLGRLYVLK